MNELPQERLTIGIHACAHAEYMFEETRRYLMQRKAYGKTLSSLQVYDANNSICNCHVIRYLGVNCTRRLCNTNWLI